MTPDCDCENPHVVFVRESVTPDGRKNKYYKCLSGGKDQMTSVRDQDTSTEDK